jgi:alpha-beta hydrolase superfamily lysophospholipase
MRQKVIIFHGTGARPEWIWYPWLAGRLRGRGYAVEVPHHPGINVEPIATFLPKVFDAHAHDEETVLVGHSGGAALLLAILEQLEVAVPQAGSGLVSSGARAGCPARRHARNEAMAISP